MKEAIRKFRKEKYMTQRSMAALLDVSISCIKSWESGRRRPNRRSMKDLKRIGFDYEEKI